MTDMNQRSPLSSLSKDTMNINNNNMPFGANRMGYKPDTVINTTIIEQPIVENVVQQKDCYGKWMNYLFWFVIIAIIAWFLLFSLRPEWVLKHHHREHNDCNDHNNSNSNNSNSNNDCNSGCNDDCKDRCGEIDHCRVLAGAVIIALIAIFIIWLFQWGCGSYNKY
jgi:hypothetical protein